MELVPDRMEAFLELSGMVSVDDAIIRKCAEVVAGSKEEVETAKRLFEWVRDKIPHTKDIQGEVVTCQAKEVFKEGTGICFAKAHLLAAMLRHQGIPCGFCYQVFENDVQEETGLLALHGLNAIFLETTGKWHFVDPRGNQEGIHAEFSLGEPSLAFPELAFLDNRIYAEPLDIVVQGLETADSISTFWPVLPAVPRDAVCY